MFLFLKFFGCINLLTIRFCFVSEHQNQGHECDIEERTNSIRKKEGEEMQSSFYLVTDINLILLKYGRGLMWQTAGL